MEALARKAESSVVGFVDAVGAAVGAVVAVGSFAVPWQLVSPAGSACASAPRPLWPDPGSISVGREQLDMTPEDWPHLISWTC